MHWVEGSAYIAAFEVVAGGGSQKLVCPSPAAAARHQPCTELDVPLLWQQHVTLASAAQAAAS
jgi:hypothetical protein